MLIRIAETSTLQMESRSYIYSGDKWETDFKRLYKYFTPHCRYGYYPVMI